MIIKLLLKFIKALNSNVSPRQLGNGFALGCILGISPQFGLLNVLMLLLIYFLQVNIPIAIVSAAIYKLIGILIAKYSHVIGYYFLVEQKGLFGIWTSFYNMPVVPWTKFYNTVVLGSLLISILLYIPNYFFGKHFVLIYRKYILSYIEKTRFAKIIKGSKLFKLYNKYQSIKSEL